MTASARSTFSDERKQQIENARRALPANQLNTAGALADILFAKAPVDDLELQSSKALAELLQKARKVETSTRRMLSVEDFADDQTLVTLAIDNRPFVVDSTLAQISASGHASKLVLHPIIKRENGKRTSLVLVVLEHLDKAAAKALKDDLTSVLDQVRLVTSDWQGMLARLGTTVAELRTMPPPIPADQIAETIQFLEWLQDNNFTFMGLREYRWAGDRKNGSLEAVKNSALGILKNPDLTIMTRGGEPVVLTPQIREFLFSSNPLIITKANVKSVVHRRSYLDYIGIKQYDSEGGLLGELRIVGLFTSSAYTRSVMTIPLLRHKANAVLNDAMVDPDGHTGRSLINILETWPRDELFQLSTQRLSEFAQIAIQLEERPRIRVLSRADRFDRFVAVLVYVPRERYDSGARQKIGAYLADVFDGRLSAWYPQFLENGMTRVHFVIGRDEGKTPTVSRRELEQSVSDIVRTWSDRFAELAQENDGSDAANASDVSFPIGYQEVIAPKAALSDAAAILSLQNPGEIAVDFHSADPHDEECLVDDKGQLALKLFHLEQAVPLSRRVPMLENMGFSVIEESTFAASRSGGDSVYIHDMQLKRADGRPIDRDALDKPLADCLLAVWRGMADNDAFNSLVLTAGLDWQKASVFRAYARYLRQVQPRFTVESMAACLSRWPAITIDLANLFAARFDPGTKKRQQTQDELIASIQNALESVASNEDDRIIRDFLDTISATLRTNFYQTQREIEDSPQPVLALKFDAAKVPAMPQPVPYREIFVSSPRVEGVHLRFGPVARGGLRWSDRPQDYRTEVLGLVKAQQVKNAVIVPVGAKGGFFPRQLPDGGDRDAWFTEGKEAYKIFISSMLSVTDNLSDDKVIAPPDTVRHDGDDPYFVVAADKGTSTFSDTANGISQDYDYWLDDAFASGGSAGYDHKKMGITARGGWEAVKRHFREMNRDIQSEPFTVAGVGDMSGDVFGNGMLLSEQTQLVAAFDHRDIFIDPDPDPAKSFKERKRLFAQARSSWQDYDTTVISKGGGVFSRSSKSIHLNKACADALGAEVGDYSVQQVLSLILKAPVDLMWFGGIGTYIKASHESHADAGDRGNDPIRVDADEVRAKVIGEGANLGITQPARIEFDENGGRINTDAIDNSAGVNSSDVEVNIKIALAPALRSGSLKRGARDTLLEGMTDEVADLVLRNNYLQTLAISLTERMGMEDHAHQQRLMQSLETRGLLDREVEDLPSDSDMAERASSGDPLTRPELAVLLAYAKIVALDDLTQTDVPDEAYLQRELMRYFPQQMQKDFADDIEAHRLRREIIGTVLANSMINRGGPTLISRVENRTGADIATTAKAFVMVRDAFDLQAINGEIDALDTKIDGQLQLELYNIVRGRVLSLTVWFARYGDFSKGLQAEVDTYRSAVETLSPNLTKIVPDFLRDRIEESSERFREGGVPAKLADKLGALPIAGLIPDIQLVSKRTGASLENAAEAFFAITKEFQVGRIVQAASDVPENDLYDSLAVDRALQNLHAARRNIVIDVLSSGSKGKQAAKDPVENWLRLHEQAAKSVKTQLRAITEADSLSVSRLMVASNVLGDLVSE